MPKADIAILTVIPEEYEAVVLCLSNFGCTMVHDFGSSTTPNQFGWVFGELRGSGDQVYRIVVGMVVQPGPGRMAAAVSATISRYELQYILLVGIAGGFPQDGLAKGDVVIASVIYDYDYGKVATDFQPRMDFSYQTDQALLTSAIALHTRDKSWAVKDRSMRPESGDTVPKLLHGAVASGGKIIDNANNDFFAKVLKAWPRLIAVEMEGAGAAAAIETAKAAKHNVGFIMVRGISDMPRMGDADQPAVLPPDGNKAERDMWKIYAANTAANFTIHWISKAWPLAPVPKPVTLGFASGTPTLPSVSTQALTVVEIQPANDGLSRTLPSDQQHKNRDQFKSCSGQLLNWPTDLGQGEWILRPELRSILDRISSSNHSVTLLLGVPGSGKSALLARLGNELMNQNVCLVAIKADSIDEKVNDAASLASFLGLSRPVGELIRGIAQKEKVVLLIDQLDALASLVDLNSGRLNILLNLIREVDELENVHVVCSCREFEYQHDARLTSIDADRVTLSLPTWEQVTEVLKKRGIAFDEWPPTLQELLRPPQQLKVFLQCVTDSSEHRVFSSYQQMLDDLWQKRISNPGGLPGRSDLIMELATEMANRESLWVPEAHFENREVLVEHLIGSGLLTRAKNGNRIGFAHQTLFTHAWARAFARNKCSLASYALMRQNGLFIRATVWAGLTYLRGADPANYRREFGLLWNDPNLRRHLRYLLIEFLGGVQEPEIQEEAWLAQALVNPELEGKVLSAIRDSKEWFSILSKNHIPRIMNSDTPNQGFLTGVLIGGMSADCGTCLTLLKDHWYSVPSRDPQLWHVLNYLPSWNDDAFELANGVAKRSNFSQVAVHHLAAHIAESNVGMAIRLVAESFKREIEQRESVPDPTPPHLPAGASESDHLVQRLTFKPKERFQELIDDRGRWYGLADLAEKDPREFLVQIWPLFIRALEGALEDIDPDPRHYKTGYCIDPVFDDRDDEFRKYPLCSSIDFAMRKVAQSSDTTFFALLDKEKARDSLLVQRFIARGLAEIAASHPDLGLRFLTEDARRFNLGPHTDDHHETMLLIQVISPHLTVDAFLLLENAILQWNYIQTAESEYDAQSRFQAMNYNRKHRLRLLAAMPFDRLTPGTRGLISQEQTRFPDHKDAGVSKIHGGFIGSPMSESQMKLAKDEDIVNLFKVLPDKTHSEHPRYRLRGGSDQASSEFERFAITSPDRAIGIISKLEPGNQENPVSSALLGLSKSPLPDEAIFQLVLNLDKRGFSSTRFRTDVARAISSRLKDNVGLPDSICFLLESWLKDMQPAEDFPVIERTNPSKEERELSVLWQRDGAVMIPDGAYHLLHALTYGYLLRSPSLAITWLRILQSHLEKPETESTWRLLSRDFRYLHLCNHVEATTFLHRLFDKYPGLLTSEDGAILLTNVWSFVPETDLWSWLEAIRRSSWENGAQAYGELLALRALVFPTDAIARQKIETLLEANTNDRSSLAIRVGVAFTCANMWEDNRSRELSTTFLLRLIRREEEKVAKAISLLFLVCNSFPVDGATHQLLEALIEYPKTLEVAEDGWLLERLESLLPNEATNIYKLCMQSIRFRSNVLDDYKRSWAMHNANLTNIALTLHRMEEPLRSMGLELFECMLEIKLPDAEGALREIDSRMPGTGAAIRTRPRRQKRSTQKQLSV